MLLMCCDVMDEVFRSMVQNGQEAISVAIYFAMLKEENVCGVDEVYICAVRLLAWFSRRN